MKLHFSNDEVVSLLQPKRVFGTLKPEITFLTTDTRTYSGEPNACFIALQGPFRRGTEFLDQAYSKGIHIFILSEIPQRLHADATYFLVDDSLAALQCFAKAHRQKFNFPIIGISGKAGKTTVKEWLYELLKFDYTVVRSPKSYNSQIGVALSLLELHGQASMAVIEMGISEPGEMNRLMDMVQPTHLLVTSWFNSALDNQLREASEVTEHVYMDDGNSSENASFLSKGRSYDPLIPFADAHSLQCARLAIGLAAEFGVSEQRLKHEVPCLTRLALRLETFHGKNNTLVLNDTYNLDVETLSVSLQYMVSMAGQRPRCIYIGLDESTLHQEENIKNIIRPFAQEHVYVGLPELLPFAFPEGAMVFIKGTRKAHMERFAARFRAKQHQTVLEINLSALRNNLAFLKSRTSPETKLLAMVKAQSYGSGLEQMASFLEGQGVDYLGVAYTTEGVALRNHGVKLPILVLNPDPASYGECINHQLEPTVFTFAQLDRLIRELIFHGIQHFPIHVEIDTGMRRLGFEPSEIKPLIALIKAQPEVRLKTVFTHFVESDNLKDKSMGFAQIEAFTRVKESIEEAFSHPMLFHMANSDAVLNFPEAHFGMVRIGLGMFGLSNSPEALLEPVLSWKCLVSQIKQVRAGESVGYSRSFVATQDTTIAILPLGYADGFPRRLSNGVGSVKIRGFWCPTVGKVCMDMLMLDVSEVPEVQEGDEAILFDDIASMLFLAERLQTIPYELMTGISERVHRVYVRE